MVIEATEFADDLLRIVSYMSQVEKTAIMTMTVKNGGNATESMMNYRTTRISTLEEIQVIILAKLKRISESKEWKSDKL